MAEDALEKKRAYDPTLDQPTPKKLGRRDALAVIGAIAAGLAIGIPTVFRQEGSSTTESPKPTLELLLEQGIKPTNVYIGDIRIIKEIDGAKLNVRSAPNTNQDSSISSWVTIESFNGVNIQNVNELLIKNSLFVEGEFVDNPAGTKGEKGLWLVGNVGTNTLGVKKEEPKYISYSSSTGQLVIPLGGEFQKITQFDKNGVTIGNGQKISAKEIGLVTHQTKAP